MLVGVGIFSEEDEAACPAVQAVHDKDFTFQVRFQLPIERLTGQLPTAGDDDLTGRFQEAAEDETSGCRALPTHHLPYIICISPSSGG